MPAAFCHKPTWVKWVFFLWPCGSVLARVSRHSARNYKGDKKAAARPFAGQRDTVFIKSKSECRYVAFTKINYLIINELERENNNKKLTFLLTA